MKWIYPVAALSACTSTTAQQRPNILVIQCDHLTQRIVGAYGETQGATPAIDRIASAGVVFANAYVGCPLSQPSRAALWSGLMPHQTGVRSNSGTHINPELPDSVPTLGSVFAAHGYQAVHFGKTHDGGALRGFRHKEPVPEPFADPHYPVNNDSFLDVGTCRDAVEYLSNAPAKPFICVVDFQNPHTICGYVGANRGVHTDTPVPDTLPELPANFEVACWSARPVPVQYICCTHRRMAQASQWSETNYRHYLAAYRHYTQLADRQIGQVLDALYSTPAGRNTVVIILADHGDGLASHRMVTKQVSFYEEVTNVPLLAAGPGIRQRSVPVSDLLVQPTTDLLPTLCELAAIPAPEGKPGISFAPVLKGEEQLRKHPYVASEWHSEYEVTVSPGRMIRSARYKYTHYLEGGEELYDLQEDKGETKNLASHPDYAGVLARHRALLDDYIRRTGDDYRQLQVEADPRWRSHTPGYPHHTGPCARDIVNRK